MNVLISSLSVLLVSALVMSCRSGEGTEKTRTKTLDSIASGKLDIEQNQCKGSATVEIDDSKIKFDKKDAIFSDEAEKSRLRQAVKNYFSALPPYSEKLFLKLGGQVLITTQVDKFCKPAEIDRKSDAVQGEVTEGCFNFIGDPTGNSAPIFAIIHSPDAKKIQYYGPQIFGYLYAQLYSRLTLTADGKSLDLGKSESITLMTRKEKVANAFLQDMLDSQEYQIETLKNLLGENSATELQLPSNKHLAPLDRLSALKNEVRRKQVLDYVFANSFQSAHCNDHSRDVAKKKFPRSSDLFEEINNAVVDVSGMLLGLIDPKTSGESKTHEGFALAGEDLFSSLMPFLGGMMGASAGNSGGLPSMFNSLLGVGSMGGGPAYMPNYNSNYNNQSQLGMYANNYNSLANAGCSGGNCPNFGSCAGGSCSTAANGGCGGNCGSCNVLT